MNGGATVKTESHGRVSALSAALFVLSIPLLAQKVSPAFPRDRAKNVLDNETVAIWDVTWPKGKSTGMLERRYDQVTVTLSDGGIKVTRPDQTWTVEYSRLGGVQYESKGTVAEEEGVSDRARRAMVFEIKSYTPPPVAPDVVKLLKEKKTQGVPGQFDPANGGVKLFENDKITIWQKTWNPRGSLHAHYSWIAGVWIQPGVQGQVAAGKGVLPPCPLEKAARTADGWPRTPSSPDECQASDETVAQLRAGTNITQFGAIRWGPPGLVHQEEGLGFPGYSPPASRAIFVEFKEVPTSSSSTTR
jgi:hypothetical protein